MGLWVPAGNLLPSPQSPPTPHCRRFRLSLLLSIRCFLFVTLVTRRGHVSSTPGTLQDALSLFSVTKHLAKSGATGPPQHWRGQLNDN